MPQKLSDAEIEDLIKERKILPKDFLRRAHLKPKEGHQESELDLIGLKESRFRIILRKSNENPLDFSVILAYIPPNSNEYIRIRRYNGKSHRHSNKLEKDRFYEFHIHTATERYQTISGMKEDAFAMPTNRFKDFNSALQCLIEDCGFDIPNEDQGNLFLKEGHP